MVFYSDAIFGTIVLVFVKLEEGFKKKLSDDMGLKLLFLAEFDLYSLFSATFNTGFSENGL